MHDPAEMIRKIAELEKGLPKGNRPETLYARAALLQAETQAKLLFVLIDLSKNFDRFTDTLAMALTQPEVKIVHRLDNIENILNEIHPEMTPARKMTPAKKWTNLTCRQCDSDVQYLISAAKDEANAFACNCVTIPEGNDKPVFWYKVSEDLKTEFADDERLQKIGTEIGKGLASLTPDPADLKTDPVLPVTAIQDRESVTLVAGEPGSRVDADFDKAKRNELVYGDWADLDESKEQSDSRQKVSAPVSEEKLPEVEGLGEFDAEESKSSGDEAAETGDQK